MKSLWLCLVLAGPVWAEPVVSPANTERARQAFGAAQKLYQASRFAEALAKFEEAQALKPHPVIVFNIARCHELLGALPRALQGYREYLRLSPDASDRAAVLSSIAALEKKLPASVTQVQTLIVNADAAASVVVDGKRVGTAPVTVDLSAGEHSLEVSAPGYETFVRQVTLAPARTVELNISLRAVADVPKKEPVLIPSGPAPDPIVTQPVEPPARKRTFTWVAGGVALASVAAATGLGLGANASVAELRSGDGTRTADQSGALANQAQGLATGANVAWGVAGAAAITAVVLFFVEGR